MKSVQVQEVQVQEVQVQEVQVQEVQVQESLGLGGLLFYSAYSAM